METKTKNQTGLRSLDRLERDPRVVDIWTEDDGCFQSDGGKDRLGIWIQLAPGFNWRGCSCCHEGTVRDALTALRAVEVGDPY